MSKGFSKSFYSNEWKEKHNQKLSQNRAEEIKKYMISKGIDAKRISTIGYGETVPKYPNDSPKIRRSIGESKQRL